MPLIRENAKIWFKNNKNKYVGPLTLQFSEEDFNYIYNLLKKKWVSYKNIYNFIRKYDNGIEEIVYFIIYNIPHSNLKNIEFYNNENDFIIEENYLSFL